MKYLLLAERYIPYVILLFGSIGIYLSIHMANPYVTTISSSLIVASIISIGLGNNNKHQVQSEGISKKRTKIMGISFFILVFSKILFSYMGYSKSIVFFVSLLIFSVPVYMLLQNVRKFIYLPILLFSIIAFVTPKYFSTGYYLGNDSLFHNRIGREIAISGSLSPLLTDRYYYSPLYHVQQSISNQFLSVGSYESTYISFIIIYYIIFVLTTFLIGEYIFDERVGKATALLFVTSDWVIKWGIDPQVTSLGVLFFVLIFSQLIRPYKKRSVLLSVIFLFCAALTHQTSLFIIAVAGFSYSITKSVFKKGSLTSPVLFGPLVFISHALITQHGGPEGNQPSFFVSVGGNFVSSILSSDAQRSVVSLPSDPTIHSASSEAIGMLNAAGTGILFLFSILGALYLIKSGFKKEEIYSIGITVGLMCIFIFVAPLFGIRNLMPWRWFAFLYLPLSLFAAVGILYLISAVKGVSTKQTMIISLTAVILFLILPALMMGNFTGSFDDPIYDDNPGAERNALSEEEESLISFVQEYTKRNEHVVTGDRTMTTVIERHYGYGWSSRRIEMEYQNPDTMLTNNGREVDLLMYRSYMETEKARFYLYYEERQFSVHSSIPVSEIERQGINNVYYNGDTKALNNRALPR